MNVNGKTLAATTIAALVVGSLLSTGYGARPTPKSATPALGSNHNHIRLEIRSTGKVVLAPQPDDTIDWYPQPTSANSNPLPAVINFVGSTPCKQQTAGQNISSCDIDQSAAPGDFDYVCVMPTCYDPGVDPSSQTGTVLRLRVAGNGAATSAPAGTPTVQSKTAGLVATGAGSSPSVTVSCDSNGTTTRASTPSILIQADASQDQMISWIGGRKLDFTITTTPSKFCKEDTGSGIKADRIAICTVPAKTHAQTVQYTVSGVCTNPGTFNIQVQ